MQLKALDRISIVAMTLAVGACGGGGGATTAVTPTPSPPTDPFAAAATQTVQTNANCTALNAFYWEIGDANGVLASGTSGSGAPGATDVIAIASASKWLYSSFIVETRGSAGVSATSDVPFLNFTSGYTNFGLPVCPGNGGTIDDCLNSIGSLGVPRGTLSPENVGKFYYDSAHMEKHASNSGYGNLTGVTLGTAVSQTLGITVTYSDAQPAGSGKASASEYAKFLRKVLSGSLRITSLLGADPVCTWHDNYVPACSAVNSPTDSTPYHWHYSLGHWVEDDDSNRAYSSAGAFGFYPWVSADLKLYGIIARYDPGTQQQEGFRSAQCGRLVRLAYQTGQAQ